MFTTFSNRINHLNYSIKLVNLEHDIQNWVVLQMMDKVSEFIAGFLLAVGM